MAVQVYPDDGKPTLLADGIPANLYYWGYVNDFTPDDNTVIGDLDVVSYIAGVNVPFADFTLNSLSAHVARSTAEDIAIENVGGSNTSVYGYFATDNISSGDPAGHLILALRFDDAPRFLDDGDSMAITPTIALGVC